MPDENDELFGQYEGIEDYVRKQPTKKSSVNRAPQQTRLATPREQRQIRREDQAALSEIAETQYRNLPFNRRLAASVRNAAQGIPIVGGFVDRQDPDLQLMQTARPKRSSLAKFISGAGAYSGLATAAPGLFSSVLPSAATIGGIEATDAAIRGKNPLISGSIGAISAVPGGLLTRAITPKSAARSAQSRAAKAGFERINRVSLIEEMLNRQLENQARGAPRDTITGSFRKRTPDKEIARTESLLNREYERRVRDIVTPAPRIPSISNNPGNFESTASTAAGMLLSPMMGAHPVTGAIAGYLAPQAARRGINMASGAINTVNDRLLNTEGGRNAYKAFNKYLDNALLSDKDRAILNAILGFGANQSAQPNSTMLQNRIPRLME